MTGGTGGRRMATEMEQKKKKNASPQCVSLKRRHVNREGQRLCGLGGIPSSGRSVGGGRVNERGLIQV